MFSGTRNPTGHRGPLTVFRFAAPMRAVYARRLSLAREWPLQHKTVFSVPVSLQERAVGDNLSRHATVAYQQALQLLYLSSLTNCADSRSLVAREAAGMMESFWHTTTAEAEMPLHPPPTPGTVTFESDSSLSDMSAKKTECDLMDLLGVSDPHYDMADEDDQLFTEALSALSGPAAEEEQQPWEVMEDIPEQVEKRRGKSKADEERSERPRRSKRREDGSAASPQPPESPRRRRTRSRSPRDRRDSSSQQQHRQPVCRWKPYERREACDSTSTRYDRSKHRAPSPHRASPQHPPPPAQSALANPAPQPQHTSSRTSYSHRGTQHGRQERNRGVDKTIQSVVARQPNRRPQRHKPHSGFNTRGRSGRSRTPGKWGMPPSMMVPLKFTREYWEKHRDELKKPVWRDYTRAACVVSDPACAPTSGGEGAPAERKDERRSHAPSQPRWLREDRNAARYFDKAKDAFGGMSLPTEDLCTRNRYLLRTMADEVVDDDDCEDLDLTRQMCFPTMLAPQSRVAGTVDVRMDSWSELCRRAAFLKARWSSQPSVARVARATRSLYLANCSFDELLEACDEALTWLLWHQFEDERLCPHDPIFANIYALGQGLTARLGAVFRCHLAASKSPLADQARTAELPLQSATCPLTLFLTFADRFARIMHNHPHTTLVNHRIVDHEGILRTLYLPGMCARKIPLVLDQHANVCRKEECRLLCAQLLGKQYTVGKFFHCDLYE